MKYRIFYDDSENCEIDSVEVEADGLASALFLAGMQVAQNGDPIGPLTVTAAEAASWARVKLP